MRIGIIEDNKEDQTLLFNLLSEVMKQYNFKTEIDSFISGEQFLELYEKNIYDLLFVDIYMSGITGIQMAKKLREKENQCHFVFLTSSTDYIEESYDVEAMRYMLKPIDKIRLNKVMKKYVEIWVKKKRFLKVMIDRQEYTIPYSKIEAIITVGRNIEIHTDNKILTTTRRQSFEELTKSLLEDYRFVLLSQGIIVNFNYINRVEGNNALMKSNTKFPISRRRMSTVIEAFVRFQLAI